MLGIVFGSSVIVELECTLAHLTVSGSEEKNAHLHVFCGPKNKNKTFNVKKIIKEC